MGTDNSNLGLNFAPEVVFWPFLHMRIESFQNGLKRGQNSKKKFRFCTKPGAGARTSLNFLTQYLSRKYKTAMLHTILSLKYLTSETAMCMKYTVERSNKLFDSRVLRVIIDINKT